MNSITSFKGKNRFLSNFWPCKVAYEGIVYPSSEHAYMAAKTTDLTIRTLIRNCSTPGKAKRLGRSIELRPDWEQVKFAIMYEVVKDKFTRSPILAAKLKATAGIKLIEGNTWGDTIWGVCNGKGENHLGKILMRVREELADD